MSVLHELGLAESDLGALMGDGRERRARPSGPPARKPNRRVAAVEPFSASPVPPAAERPAERDVLAELDLTEADLAEAVDSRSAAGRPTDLRRDPIVRRLVNQATWLLDRGVLPPERVLADIRESGYDAPKVDAALRLVEARVAARADREDETDADLRPLEEGLGNWLDARVTTERRRNG